MTIKTALLRSDYLHSMSEIRFSIIDLCNHLEQLEAKIKRQADYVTLLEHDVERLKKFANLDQ